MQDVFIEYMVKRRRTLSTSLAKFGIAAGSAIIAFAAFTLSLSLGPLSFIGVLAAFAALWGAHRFITGFNVEYEYSLTNGEMDVDKIIAERRRKRLISIKLREVEDFGRFKTGEHENKIYQQKIFACDHPASEDLWFVVTNVKDKGMALIVFNASERMIDGSKPYLPRPIFHRVFQNRVI